MKYLDKISSPADFRQLPPAELPVLAQEIRDAILETLSQNPGGGHLASSLGAVELTIALHKVFDTPKDKIIFDVGHQGYPHKLVTGRYAQFNTLRLTGGISGFLRRDESEYDVFGAGHAGTSISAALGIAQARDISSDDFKVVAVIGDGSMTCGLPFEGLNNAGHTSTDLLVVLNDNEMSISGNVGALSKYLNALVQSRFYNNAKEEAYSLVKRAPLGDRVIRIVHKLEESTKGLILPSVFFEDLGFRYIGPIDGHDLEQLVATLSRIRDFRGPVLLHAITRKGKGYKIAESDATVWHAPGNFAVDTGEIQKSTSRTYTHVFGDTMVELAQQDKRVVAITAAMCTGTGLVEFSEKFPQRHFDVGIAESHAVTAAAGMALQGLRPFVTIYSAFMQRAYDNIIHDVALQQLPVVFAMDRAGLVGYDGPTHHGLLDVGFMRSMPNMVVMAPKDGQELRDMMLTALNHNEGPICFRYPRANVGKVDTSTPARVLPIGKWQMVREGDAPVALLSYGSIYANVMKAVAALDDQGVKVAVVNARFAKPLDTEMLRDLAERYAILISAEDGAITGGFGSAVNEALVQMGIARQCWMIGVGDRFIEHGDLPTQHEAAGISPSCIAATIRERIAAAPQALRVNKITSAA